LSNFHCGLETESGKRERDREGKREREQKEAASKAELVMGSKRACM